MKIFGTDYDTPDGTCLRDYIHVNDIASAHVHAELRFDQGLTKAEVNIGTGQAVSNLEILKTIEKVTGRTVPYDEAPRRASDVTKLYANGAKPKKYWVLSHNILTLKILSKRRGAFMPKSGE